MTNTDCGAACLASILRHHDLHASLAECREQVGLGRDGVTAQAIATGARSFGLRVKAYGLDSCLLANLLLPAVAHWEEAHFVVLERITEDRIEMMDPAVGHRWVTREEFMKSAGAAVLTFELTPAFAKRPPAPDQRCLAVPAAVRPQLATHRKMLISALAASLALQLFGFGLPVTMAILVDHVVSRKDRGPLVAVGLFIAFLTLSQLVLTHLRSLVLIRLQLQVDKNVMQLVFRHLLSLPLRFFQQRASGDLLQRLASTAVIRELITTQALAAVLDGTFMLVYLVLMLAANPLLGGFVCGIGAVQAVLMITSRSQSLHLHQQHLLAQSKSQSILYETLAGIATVKATGSEERLFNVWSRRFSTEISIVAEKNRLAALVQNATTALQVLAPLMLVWIGAGQVLDGTLTLGTVIALQALAMAFLMPLGGVIATVQRLQAARPHTERLQDILDEMPEEPRPALNIGHRLTGRIEVQNLDFRYSPNSPLILRDITVSIEPGQKVALVGRTGSGKTTLGMLLLGLYLADRGEILYDGVTLKNLDRQEVRKQFGVVLQEPFIFGDSIRSNIAGNDSEIPLEQIRKAARIASFADEIAQMPMGFETRLGDGGGGLSGGQRQRLAIARAVAHQPVLLLLDESTSHLDALTEQCVDTNLDLLSCTRIVIAHRVSTVRNADLILVLEGGKIIERGRHDDLLSNRGLYASLVEGQIASPSGVIR